MDISIEEGAFVTLLGPSGCGKTTTLRMIAGLLSPSQGDIRIKGRSVTATPIHKRNLGLVFQNYALFPHKTIFDNVAFGLKYRDVGRREITDRVQKALDLVQLPGVGDRHPAQLSGGQQQRIALARAIVIEPDVLLLDEPLSALDANLREDMRVELKRIQEQLGITTIFVTHDQSEALAMSDKVVVMRSGHVEQVGAPEDVYVNPASAFVARFLGNANLIPATVKGRDGDHVIAEVAGVGSVPVPALRAAKLQPGDAAALVVRAERLQLVEQPGDVPEGMIARKATVTAVDYQGQAARYFIDFCGHSIQALNPIGTAPLRAGARVTAVLDSNHCVLVPPEKHP
ncbi:polyamine ABC transporter ATP-binding protein [Phyllobacterium phragmitis]|uniref:Polyamine ABC transporter ATP-binding protein n=2 Tax=Phyllobacterium phragmitis TaxID=2670329 RepID=A0A2S9IWQ3_9HYPH|nr:polyamine ABC transporter ATP-binding protein [Phyllobacterium phragmitis]